MSDVFYLPGEHHVFAENGKEYLARHGMGAMGNGWGRFDYKGVRFVCLNQVSVVQRQGPLAIIDSPLG